MSPIPLKKKAEEEEPSNFGLARVFKYEELKKATNSFDTELGAGGFGRVYLGTLPDGREVAVKVLFDPNPKRRLQQFFNEISSLSRLRHKNLVALYGCTSPHNRELLLVYDYVPNGTVADHLHGQRSDLTLALRIRMAVETAEALTYLHALEPPIIHRDVKTSNILLDNSYHVKVADLGICRLLPYDTTHVSTVPQGTMGYRDPEYERYCRLSVKSDVYSFGVVLAELISGQEAVDVNRNPEDIYLDRLAFEMILNKKIKDFVDPKLGYHSNRKVKSVINSVAKLAHKCLHPKALVRPSMVKVLSLLKEIQNEMLGIGQNAAAVMSFGPQRDLSYGNLNNERHKILKDIQNETQQIGVNEVDAISFGPQEDLVDGNLSGEAHKNLKGLQNGTQQIGLSEVCNTSLSPQQELGDGSLNNERHEIMKGIQVGLNKVDVISSDPQRELSDGSLPLNTGLKVVLMDLDGGGGDGNEQKKPVGDQKPKPSQASIVVLKIERHCECEACTEKIRKTIRKVKGVENVTMEDEDLVTVTGIMDMRSFPTRVQEKLKKAVEVVLQKKEDNTSKGEKKKTNGGSGGEEGKKNEGGDQNVMDKKGDGSVQEVEKANEGDDGGGMEKMEDDSSEKEKKINEDGSGGGADKKEGGGCGGEKKKNEGSSGGGVDKKEDSVGGGEERKWEGGIGGGTKKREGDIGGIEEKKKEGGDGEREKENEGSGGGGMDKKASYDGGGEEKKKDGGMDKKKEGGGEKEEGKVAAATMNKMYYHMPHYDLYQIEMVHAPQMFSDENPNACSIM